MLNPISEPRKEMDGVPVSLAVSLGRGLPHPLVWPQLPKAHTTPEQCTPRVWLPCCSVLL